MFQVWQMNIFVWFFLSDSCLQHKEKGLEESSTVCGLLLLPVSMAESSVKALFEPSTKIYSGIFLTWHEYCSKQLKIWLFQWFLLHSMFQEEKKTTTNILEGANTASCTISSVSLPKHVITPADTWIPFSHHGRIFNEFKVWTTAKKYIYAQAGGLYNATNTFQRVKLSQDQS